MITDPVVEEVRAARHAYADQFGNDLSAMVADLRRLETVSDRKLVSFPPKRIAKKSSRRVDENDES